MTAGVVFVRRRTGAGAAAAPPAAFRGRLRLLFEPLRTSLTEGEAIGLSGGAGGRYGGRGGAIRMRRAASATESYAEVPPGQFYLAATAPLSTFAAPQPGTDDTPLVRRLKRLHSVVSVCSLLSLLLAVMYATIATNKLNEGVVAQTASLKALLVEGEFALPWT